MKLKPIFIVFGIALLSLLFVFVLRDTVISLVTSSRVNFDQVEKTGGINLGTPINKDNHFYLPVECNAIGKFINKEPKVVNSAPLAYYKAVIKQKKGNIFFYLKVRFDKNYKTNEIKEIGLGKLQTGRCKVYYLNSDNSKVYLKDFFVQ